MSVIKCPNCGCEIFNETKKINHFNSQSSIKTTKVKIPPFFTGIQCDKLCEVEIRVGTNLVWQGLSNSIAFFRLDSPQTVSFFIKEVYTHHPFLFFKNFIIKANLQPDKSYEIKPQSILQKNADPTKLKYFFSETNLS